MNARQLRWLRVGLGLLVVVFLLGSYGLSKASKPRTEASAQDLGKVVVFAVPNLQLDDVESGAMPNLDRLSKRGAIAVLTVRTLPDRPNLVAAFSSLGAGNRTAGSERAPEVVPSDSPWFGTTPLALVEQRVGHRVSGDLAIPSFPEVAAEVAPEGGTTVGALGSALRAKGRQTAFVGQSGSPALGPGQTGVGALAAADSNGLIDTGSVDDSLVTTIVGGGGPDQTVSNPRAFAAAVAEAQETAELVVVDAGDTTRAQAVAAAEAAARQAEEEQPAPTSATTSPAAGSTTTTEVPSVAERTEMLRSNALGHTDRTLGRVADELAPGTLLLVIGVTPSGTSWGFTPLVASGPGIERGYLDSASTHRPALVTITDLAPTILDTLGVKAPRGMIGQPLRFRAASSTWDEARTLDALIANRASVDRTMSVLFVGAQALLYGIAALVIVGGRGFSEGARRWFVVGALTCAAWAPATYLLRIWTPLYSMGSVTIVLSWAIAMGIALVARQFRFHPLDPALVVAGLTVAVLVADLATGAHLQVGSFFGYMPHTAPRYTGLGNSGFALLAGSSLVLITVLVARAQDRRAAWSVALAIALVVAAADGAPWMGSDVGGTLALVPALGICLWTLRGRPIRVKTVLTALGLGALALGLAVGSEALRQPADRTHVGRFFLEVGSGEGFWDTLGRKWSTNIADLGRSPIYWVVPLLVAVGVVAVRRSPALARLLPAASPQRIIVVTSLFAGIVGWLVNDSGVVVLALACIPFGPVLLLAATDDRPIEPVGPPGPLAPAHHRPEATPGAEAATSLDPPSGGEQVVVALVPARDRADSVADTVRALNAIEQVDRVLVIDDGSVDDTADRALAAGAEVLRLTRNRGKGGAVLAGAARCGDATVFLLIDADLARTAAAADALLGPVLDDEVDMTVGLLPSAEGKAGFGTVKKLSSEGVRRACGLETQAPLSGQRAIRASLLRGLTDAERFGLEVAMTIDVVRAGGRVREVPVPMDHRHTGRSLSGFIHRGRQGLDIARSLWPRIAGRYAGWALVAMGVAGWVIGSNLVSSSRAPSSVAVSERSARVVVVGVPRLGLDDITPERMPALAGLADEGTLALSTPRTGGPITTANAYATVGAGDRAAVPNADPQVLETASPDGQRAAAELGSIPDGEVIVPELGRWTAPSANRASHVGALGDALHDAGLKTGVVANSSTVSDLDDMPPVLPSATRWSAPAAIMVSDTAGSVDFGTVSESLLVPSDTWPGGLAADPERFVAATLDALQEAELVVVDTGETDRWQATAGAQSTASALQARERALATTDLVIAGIAAGVDADTLMLVVGITPAPGDPLSPLVLRGPGWSGGRLASSTTRQVDLAGFVDLAPTILQALGGEVPESMAGTELRRAEGRPDRAAMERTQDLIGDRDQGYPSMVDQLVWGSAVVFSVLGLLFVLGRWRGPAGAVPGGLRPLLRWLVLTLAAVPIGTYVVRFLEPLYGRGSLTIALMWAVSGLVAAAALQVRRHPLDPVLVLSATLWTIVSVDLFVGGPLQVSSYLGHTPSVAARFVGLGNAGFGAYGAAAVVLCAGLVARAPRRSGAWLLAAAVAAVTILTDGLPWLGSDVGGILSLVPVLGLMLWSLRGRRVTVVSAGIAALSGTVALAAVVAVEALRPAEDRTHIGRFFLGSDSSGALDTLERKWVVNVDLLQGSTWAWLIWFGLAFVAVVLLTHDFGRDLAAPFSAEWIGATGLFALGVLGWVTNDSGPLVAALVLSMLAAYLTLLALDDLRPVEVFRRPLETSSADPAGPTIDEGTPTP